MKSVIPFFLLISSSFSYLFKETAKDNYRCEKVKIDSLEIKDNPFVKPGQRESKNVWYNSVTWTQIPVGQVMLHYTVDVEGADNRFKDEYIDLFDPKTKTTDGSMANLMRIALGIPRGGVDPVLGERKVDSQMFTPKVCTVYFTNYAWYPGYKHTLAFAVRAKENATEFLIIRGFLIKPST